MGDYARELTGLNPRKAQYLVFIADRLEKLPIIAAAFDAGELPWTKAREIVRVATLTTEQEWLEKAKKLSNRELEKAVRKHEGTGSGEFVTMTISMPAALLPVWHDAYELAERVSGGELEKWQVLEPALAEFLSTYLAAAEEDQRALVRDRRREGSAARSAKCRFHARWLSMCLSGLLRAEDIGPASHRIQEQGRE